MTDPKVWYLSDDKSTASSFAEFAKPDEYKDAGRAAPRPAKSKRCARKMWMGNRATVYLYDMKSLQDSPLSGLVGMARIRATFRWWTRAR